MGYVEVSKATRTGCEYRGIYTLRWGITRDFWLMLQSETECTALKSQKCKLLVNFAGWKKRPWAAHQFGRMVRLPWLPAHCLCGSWGWWWGQEQDGCGSWEPFSKASGQWLMLDSLCAPGASALQPVGLASKRKALLSASSYQCALLPNSMDFV